MGECERQQENEKKRERDSEMERRREGFKYTGGESMKEITNHMSMNVNERMPLRR